MDNRKNIRHPGRRMKHNRKADKKSLDVSEKYSESLIALNESSFKIRRFMNDVSTYKENSSSKVAKKTSHESESRDKENVGPKSSLAVKKSRSRNEIKGKGGAEARATFTFQGKKGLFANGVATKTRAYCKGLMPPMWNARLNADLRSILNLAGVEATKRHATSTTSVAESQPSVSLRSRSPDATLINSRLALEDERKTTLSKQLNKQLSSIVNDDDSLVRASCSQVGLTDRELVVGENEGSVIVGDVTNRTADDASPAAPKTVNYNDYYLRFTHFIIKSISSIRIDRDELERSSKETVRFLAEFYRERLTQASDEQKKKESPLFLAKDISQSTDNVCRTQPIHSLPTQYTAHTVRSDEWPKISRMRAQTDQQFLGDTVSHKSKVYTSALELLEAVYGQNNSNENQKTFNHLSVTPPKCNFSPVTEDIDLNLECNNSFLNPVSGEKDWLPDFRIFSPPGEKKSCIDCRCMCCNNQNSLNCITSVEGYDKGSGQNVINYDFMKRRENYANRSSQNFMNSDFMNCGDNYANRRSQNNVIDYDFMNCGNPSTSVHSCPEGSCSLNNNLMRNGDERKGNTFSRVDKSVGRIPPTTTADCLTILPPKSRRLDQWKTSSRGSYGVQTKFGMNIDNSEDEKNLLMLPLRPPARESPDIHYYPRRMF